MGGAGLRDSRLGGVVKGGANLWKENLPSADSDVCLDSNNAVLVNESVCLADEVGYGVPCAFCGGC